MKKRYVKPIIEGEQFAANEYVAACYVVKCNSGEQMITYTAPNWGLRDGDNFADINGVHCYFGNIDGKKGEQNVSLTGSKLFDDLLKFFGIVGRPYHVVTVTPGTETDTSKLVPGHPNASN